MRWWPDRRAANRHLGKSERETAGAPSSAQRHTHFLDSRRIAAVARPARLVLLLVDEFAALGRLEPLK